MIAARRITIGVKTRKWDSRTFGDAPFGKRSLWIGGNAAPAARDQQWHTQVRLYEPADGIYLAPPRAPTDR